MIRTCGFQMASFLLVAIVAAAVSAQELDRSSLPIPQGPFKGHVAPRTKDSVKDFPVEVSAPKGAPNVLIIMTDDVGFGASSTFGGPIPTPTMERLAKSGLRYTQFHTTALCSPTRAALITGRNHHTCATGAIMELGVGFPGYNTLMPKSCGTVAQILKCNGYNTSWYGKNHNVPDWHTSQAGPFDLWPTGLGFEYFYGFVGGDTSQWAPALYENTKPIEPDNEDGEYFFDVDMADKTIAWMKMHHAVAPDKPFFAYYAPGTAHAPHHAPPEWIEKFKGKFDKGWDEVREETLARQKKLGVVPQNTKLTERPDAIPAWEDLNDDQKKVFAHMMEVYCAALAHCDYQMGRLIDAIDEMGELDNTLIIYIQGDNGASAEGGDQGMLNEMTVFNGIPEKFSEVLRRMDELGGPTTFNHYPAGWAHAMDAPFQWTKQVASHFGGTRNGLVISWPARIKDGGGIRTQFHHVIDITPTILEAADLPQPTSINGITQKPIEGVSMVYSFDDAQVKSKRTTQYFEMFGNRALYHDDWVAATTPAALPWKTGNEPPIDQYKWELYNIGDDFSEANNLAKAEPEKLRGLQEMFWVEAAMHNALPIENSRIDRFDVSNRPSLTRGRKAFTYFPGMVRIPEGAAPDMKNRSFGISADVEIPADGAEGVLLTQGGRFCGWGLYLLKGVPKFHYNIVGVTRYDVSGKEALKPGKHTVVLDFDYDGGGQGKGGTATLSVDGAKVGQKHFDISIPLRISLDETLDCGEDTGTPVCEDYKVPFKFTGKLQKATINIADQKLTEEQLQQYREGRLKAALAE